MIKLCLNFHLQEFDVNHDEYLEAHEVGEALRSRNVNISDDQVAMFIDGKIIKFNKSDFY